MILTMTYVHNFELIIYSWMLKIFLIDRTHDKMFGDKIILVKPVCTHMLAA